MTQLYHGLSTYIAEMPDLKLEMKLPRWPKQMSRGLNRSSRYNTGHSYRLRQEPKRFRGTQVQKY